MLGCYAPRASECSLETTTQTGTIDSGNDRHPQPLESREQLLASVARLLCFLGSLELEKLLDIRAGNEVVRFPGDQYRTDDRCVAIDLVEQDAHLLGEAEAERVDGRTGNIERNHRNAGVARER